MSQATDELKALSERYEMRADHFQKDPRGFVIMTRRGVEHVQAKIKAVVTFETVPEYSDPSEGRYCVKAPAQREIRHREPLVMATNLNHHNAQPVALAGQQRL